MTKQQLLEIKARCEAASPGPWTVGDLTAASYLNGKNAVISVGNRLVADREAVNYCNPCKGDLQTFADMEFIAAARSDIPALLAEVERLKLEREAAIDDLSGICWACKNGKPLTLNNQRTGAYSCDYMRERGVVARGGKGKCDRWQWRGIQG